MQRILIIQTAFIGDVILATPIIEKLKIHYPEAEIDFLVRRGNGALLKGHPHLHKVFIWKKKQNKYTNLFRVLLLIRRRKYDAVINVQRFFASGLLTALSGAKHKVGFRKNPFSIFFDEKVGHRLKGQHETSRNLSLIRHLTDEKWVRPKLYPRKRDYASVSKYQELPYLCMAPTSVWQTKELPAVKWVELVLSQNDDWVIYLLGGPDDREACQEIIDMSGRKKIVNLAGRLNFLESAALMEKAVMNYTNDSAPMHMASSMDAPTNAVFCSTIPSFGFGPLGKDSKIIESKEKLSCRPCGIHGKKKCPLDHFNCAYTIRKEQFDRPNYKDFINEKQ
ncbi:MAG: glycosyltransferase family 9 protein [Vicingaceae bacterium]